ncbi:hypothetical protein QTP88_003394 [Uroleucon formosanum]
MASIVESQREKPLFVLDHFKYSKVSRPLASGTYVISQKRIVRQRNYHIKEMPSRLDDYLNNRRQTLINLKRINVLKNILLLEKWPQRVRVSEEMKEYNIFESRLLT